MVAAALRNAKKPDEMMTAEGLIAKGERDGKLAPIVAMAKEVGVTLQQEADALAKVKAIQTEAQNKVAKINHKAAMDVVSYKKIAEHHQVAAAELLAKTRQKLFDSGIDITWTAFCKEHVDYSESYIRKLLQIAKAEDPYAKLAEQNKAAAESQARTRANRSNGADVGSVTQIHPAIAATATEGLPSGTPQKPGSGEAVGASTAPAATTTAPPEEKATPAPSPARAEHMSDAAGVVLTWIGQKKPLDMGMVHHINRMTTAQATEVEKALKTTVH